MQWDENYSASMTWNVYLVCYLASMLVPSNVIMLKTGLWHQYTSSTSPYTIFTYNILPLPLICAFIRKSNKLQLPNVNNKSYMKHFFRIYMVKLHLIEALSRKKKKKIPQTFVSVPQSDTLSHCICKKDFVSVQRLFKDPLMTNIKIKPTYYSPLFYTSTINLLFKHLLSDYTLVTPLKYWIYH